MAWYYYSGNVSVPVSVRPGLTKSVRPHSKIEILHLDPQAKVLERKLLLTRTSKPRNAKVDSIVEVANTVKIQDVVKVDDWAKAISEKGRGTLGQPTLIRADTKKKSQIELSDTSSDAIAHGPVDSITEEAEVESEEDIVESGDNDGNNEKVKRRRSK